MAQTQEFTVRLSEEAVQFVRGKVSSGEYASESEVIRESLEVLRLEDEERKRWEQEVVVPAYERFKANPGSGISLAALEETLARDRLSRLETRRDAI
jgi:antitoxin ParD1/3/4